MGNRLSHALRGETFHTAGVAEVTRITKIQVARRDEGGVAADRLWRRLAFKYWSTRRAVTPWDWGLYFFDEGSLQPVAIGDVPLLRELQCLQHL
jgi:hypothetical protein